MLSPFQKNNISSLLGKFTIVQNPLIFHVLRIFKFSFFPWTSKKIFALSFLVYKNPACSDLENFSLTFKAEIL